MSRVRLVATLFVLALALVAAAPAGGAERGSLRDRIGSSKARSGRWRAPPRGSGELERKARARSRSSKAGWPPCRPGSDRGRDASRRHRGREREARRRVTRLRDRLAEVAHSSSAGCCASATWAPPDFVTVVLHADGFPQLLETLSSSTGSNGPTRDCSTSCATRAARPEARGPAARARSSASARGDRRARAPRDTLAGIAAGLRARRDTLARRTPRASPRWRARARAAGRRGELNALLADARPRARASTGPGGPWAIPWPIVQCESGGQNLPPNSAGASGYYQMLDSTWKGLGGSTPARLPGLQGRAGPARRAPVGRRRGRHNWVCADARSTQPARVGAGTASTVPVAHLGLLDEDGTRGCSRSRSRASATSCGQAIDDKPKRTTPARIKRLQRRPRATSPSTAMTTTGPASAWVQAIGTMRVLDVRDESSAR